VTQIVLKKITVHAEKKHFHLSAIVMAHQLYLISSIVQGRRARTFEQSWILFHPKICYGCWGKSRKPIGHSFCPVSV
jgi:hypothetical protein